MTKININVSNEPPTSNQGGIKYGEVYRGAWHAVRAIDKLSQGATFDPTTVTIKLTLEGKEAFLALMEVRTELWEAIDPKRKKGDTSGQNL